MKATINSSKFYSLKFREYSICQILSHFSTFKVLRYTVYSEILTKFFSQLLNDLIAIISFSLCVSLKVVKHLQQHLLTLFFGDLCAPA